MYDYIQFIISEEKKQIIIIFLYLISVQCWGILLFVACGHIIIEREINDQKIRPYLS